MQIPGCQAENGLKLNKAAYFLYGLPHKRTDMQMRQHTVWQRQGSNASCRLYFPIFTPKWPWTASAGIDILVFALKKQYNPCPSLFSPGPWPSHNWYKCYVDKFPSQLGRIIYRSVFLSLPLPFIDARTHACTHRESKHLPAICFPSVRKPVKGAKARRSLSKVLKPCPTSIYFKRG